MRDRKDGREGVVQYAAGEVSDLDTFFFPMAGVFGTPVLANVETRADRKRTRARVRVFRDLRFRIGFPGGISPSSFTLTLMRNGAPTQLSVTIGPGQSDARIDTQELVSDEDLIAWRVTPVLGVGRAFLATWSWREEW